MVRYVIVDVETTGLLPARGDRVIEIGAVAVEGGVIIAEFNSLINVGRSVPIQAQRVHGINNAMLTGQPSPKDVFPRFYEFVSGAVIIGHNARFDIDFLRHELGRLGLGLNNHLICTLELSRRLLPHLPDHRLETVARHLLGSLPEGMKLHRALDDARLTAQVWLAMEER